MPLVHWSERDEALSDELHMRDVALGLYDPAPYAVVHRDGVRDVELKPMWADEYAELEDDDERWQHAVASSAGVLEDYDLMLRERTKPVLTSEDRPPAWSADAADLAQVIESRWHDGRAAAVMVEIAQYANALVILDDPEFDADEDEDFTIEGERWLDVTAAYEQATALKGPRRWGPRRMKGLLRGGEREGGRNPHPDHALGGLPWPPTRTDVTLSTQRSLPTPPRDRATAPPEDALLRRLADWRHEHFVRELMDELEPPPLYGWRRCDRVAWTRAIAEDMRAHADEYALPAEPRRRPRRRTSPQSVRAQLRRLDLVEAQRRLSLAQVDRELRWAGEDDDLLHLRALLIEGGRKIARAREQLRSRERLG